MNKIRLIQNIREFISDVEEDTHISILSNSRVRDVVILRQVIMSLLRKHTTLTLQDIANIFGKDHSTAVHAIKQCENYYQQKDEWSKMLTRFWDKYEPEIYSLVANLSKNEQDLIDVEAKLRYKLERKKRQLREVTGQYVKALVDKKNAEKVAENKKEQKEYWEKRYLEIKAKYDSFQPSYSEEKEVLRMKGYIA